MSEKEMSDEEKASSTKQISALFHKLWTKAAGTDDYNKQDWKDLAELLHYRGVDV